MTRPTTESSFDELARGLASGSISRGKALRLMGAALVGGTLTSFGIGGVALADDRCKPTAKKCKKNKQCCSGNCSGGTCAACPSAQVLCNGSCVSTSCSEGQIFDPSSCACVAQCIPEFATCTADTQCCSGICSDFGGVLTCDDCRNPGGSCAAGERCCGGECENGRCCNTLSARCTSNGDCCGQLTCLDGVCTF
jgi:hypothetical protein